MPPGKDLIDNTLWTDETFTNRPFGLIEGNCLSDRTIYDIEGVADESQANVIMEALETKYGRGGFGYTTNYEQFETWVNGDCRLSARVSGKIIIVKYENTVLVSKHGDELMNRDKAASSNLAGHL